MFAGERAELAKAHAARVATAFQRRLAGLPEEALETTGPGGFSITLHGPDGG